MISMTTAQRSLRLQSYRSSELTTLTFTKGEVFYDADLKTLRIYDGVTGDGAVVATNSTITTALVPYSTTTQMNSAISTALGGYVTSTGLTTTLNSYSTTTQMNSAISTALGGYVSSSLSTTLSGYITSSSLTTTLNGYTTTAANALNAPIANPTFTGKITAPTAIVGGVNIKAFAIAMGAGLA
jgi:hypothetical protein